MPDISLQPITHANRAECLALAVWPEQRGLVADNARSLGQADENSELEPLGICDSAGTMAGFALIERRAPGVFSVHRLMIDAARQRRGYGRRAMQLIIEEIHARGGRTIYLSFRPENAAAQALYTELGFTCQEIEADGELLYRLGPPATVA